MNHAQQPYRTLERSAFQGRVNGADVDLFTLSNTQGAFVKVCNYGARIVQIVVPDAHGKLGDVALGFNDLAGLQRPAPYGVPSMGAFIGRYANRIAGARFELDGQAYQLSKNSGEHCIHGGLGGSRYAVFAATQLSNNSVELCHTFTPENDGFPGSLSLRVSYTLSDKNQLSIAWQATAHDAPTVASFTSHVFFNLTGAGVIDQHCVQLAAQHYLPLNGAHIPTGQLTSVIGTPFDFRQPQPLAIGLCSQHPQIALCGGYDHHYAVDGWDAALRRIGSVSEVSSGRTLTVLGTEPGVQLFTANGLDETRCGFARHRGLCIEPSYFPDSPNQAHFPSTRLGVGQTRCGEVVYAFGLTGS